MGPNETTGEPLARITNTMVIIKESYVAYDNKIPEPPTVLKGLDKWDFWKLRQLNGKMTL